MRSATCPMQGLAEIPENPSDAPHSIPRHNFERGAGVRPVLLISAKFSNVCRIAFSSISRSDGYFCCSNTKNGLSKFAHLLEISSSIMETCACWQPRLRMVMPATFGLQAYPANNPQSSLDTPLVSPQPNPWVRNFTPSILGKIGEGRLVFSLGS